MAWLGSEGYAPLAANIDVPRDGLDHLFTEMSLPEGDPLPSLGYGLAGMDAAKSLDDNNMLPWLLTRYEEREVADIQGNVTLVNYGWLDTLREHAHSFIEYENDLSLRANLTGKIVLLGKVVQPGALDTYLLPGETQPVPGVFLHGCPAATLKSTPLYEIKPVMATMIEVLIAAGVLYYLAWREDRTRRKASGADDISPVETHAAGATSLGATAHTGTVSALELYCIVAIILLVLCSLLVKYFIAWTDAVLVAFAMLIHTPCEHLWEKAGRILER